MRKAVVAHYAALVKRDVDAFLDNFHSTAVAFAPVGRPPLQGHAVLMEFLANLSSLFVELRWNQDHVVVVPHEAAVKWTARGVRRDRCQFHLEGIDVFEIDDDGRIRTLRSYWDPSAIVWTAL